MVLCFVSGFILSSSETNADSNSASAAVVVPSACSLTATNDSPHAASISPGTYQSDIGTTTLKVICNDKAGFSIYAIGFTDGVFGKTSLAANIGNVLMPDYDIVTGTATSGNTSNWAMKLATSSGATFPMAINGGFASYSTVPADYTKVASRNSNTDAGSSANGSEVTTTYAAFIAPGQDAGLYNGKVKFTIVHPYDETPATEQPSTPGYITYHANSTKALGTMGLHDLHEIDWSECYYWTDYKTFCQDGEWSNIPIEYLYRLDELMTTDTLHAPNYSREGYGFAGWSDVYDYDTNPNAHFYGSQDTFVIPDDAAENGVSLYAVWVPSAGVLQDSTKIAELCGSGANSLTQAPVDGSADLSSVSALTDLRDGQTYAIAKLADGHCWMIENLRLDNQYTTGVADKALARGYDSSFTGLADTEGPLVFSQSSAANSLYSIDGSTENTIIGNNSSFRFPRYNNYNTQQRSSYPTWWFGNTYGFGNYYTWAATIADTNDYSSGDHDTTAICPAGWHIPTGGTNSEYDLLVAQATPQYPIKFPANFVFAGTVDGATNWRAGGNSQYWSSTVSNVSWYQGNYVNTLYLHISGISYGELSSAPKFYGGSIRCLADY